jgi:Mg-chelatase subunit ChlD
VSDPAEVESLLAKQAARTLARQALAAAHPSLERVSPAVGQVDEEALAELAASDPDEAAELLADLARATDRELRRRVKELASRLLVPAPRLNDPKAPLGAARMLSGARAGVDLDLDATLEAWADQAGLLSQEQMSWWRWSRPSRAVVLVLDASGSTSGRPLTTAIVTAGALAGRLEPQDEAAVVAFWSKAVLLRHISSSNPPSQVLERLLDLRPGSTTNLAAGVRFGLEQLSLARSSTRELLVLTDGMANEGEDPVEVAGGAMAIGARLHVLSSSLEPEGWDRCCELASAGGGRAIPVHSPADVPFALESVLGAPQAQPLPAR